MAAGEDSKSAEQVRGTGKLRYGAYFEVTLDLLAEMFGLPEGARVLGITGDVADQVFLRAARVMVEHPDLPEVLEGAVPVEISPTFEWCDQAGKEILTDWGIDLRGDGEKSGADCKRMA